MRFWAWLFRWKLVWIMDRYGFFYLVRVYRDPGGLWCYYPHTGMKMRLCADGTISGQSEGFQKWIPYEKPEQVLHVMATQKGA